MTYEQYWYGDVWMVRAFRKAHELRQEQTDADAWLHGLYVQQAIAATVGNAFQKKGSKAIEYPNEPISVKEKRERTEAHKRKVAENERIRLVALLDRVIANSAEK